MVYKDLYVYSKYVRKINKKIDIWIYDHPEIIKKIIIDNVKASSHKNHLIEI